MAMAQQSYGEVCQRKGLKASDSIPAFLQLAELVLPWLKPAELGNTSLTCKALHRISKSITLARSSDATRGFENVVIPFCNTVDDHPYAYFVYTPSLILPSSSEEFQRQSWGSADFTSVPNRVGSGRPTSVDSVRLVDETGKNICGCNCQSCREMEDEDDIGCPCLSLFNGSECDVAIECGPGCACGLDCGNRLSQRGITVHLKVVKDKRKGWCVYADQSIKEGEFICEYAGELLTTVEARRRHTKHDELASKGRFSSALLVVREHLPSGKACLRMNIDATEVGNVARFINHSCDGGNMFTNLVRSSGALFPHLCFFASKDIDEGEELTFSYGEIRKKSNGLQCFCGSSNCFGILPSEDT